VRCDTEYRQPKGEAVDDEEQELQDDDAIDQLREEALREYCMLLDEL